MLNERLLKKEELGILGFFSDPSHLLIIGCATIGLLFLAMMLVEGFGFRENILQRIKPWGKSLTPNFAPRTEGLFSSTIGSKKQLKGSVKQSEHGSLQSIDD